jgi:hypothetical protein
MLEACNLVGPYVSFKTYVEPTETHPIVADSRGTASVGQESLDSNDRFLFAAVF